MSKGNKDEKFPIKLTMGLDEKLHKALLKWSNQLNVSRIRLMREALREKLEYYEDNCLDEDLMKIVKGDFEVAESLLLDIEVD